MAAQRQGFGGVWIRLPSGVHLVSDILGHKKVNLAMDVYDWTDVEDFVQPLSLVVNELCPSCSPAEAAVMSQR